MQTTKCSSLLRLRVFNPNFLRLPAGFLKSYGKALTHSIRKALTSSPRLIFYENQTISRTVTANATKTADHENGKPLKPWKEIPGPSAWPMVGAIRHFLPGGKFYGLNGLDLNNHLYRAYGPIVRLEGVFGRDPMILLFDAILRGENVYPIRPGFETLDYYRQNMKKDTKPGRPTGLITDHGKLWKELRSTVNPVLLQPKTIKLYASVLDEVALDMISRMKSLRDDKNMIKSQLDNELNLWSLESIAVVALGCRIGCLDPNLPDDSPARDLIQCIRSLFKLADKLEFKPSLWRFIATPAYNQIISVYRQQEKISKHFIQKAMAEFKAKEKSDDEKGVLEKLLEINEDFAHIMALDMLFAGVDTASNTMLATMYLLAINPEKQNKLREELRSNAEGQPYLKACMKESLRMMPVVSGNMRATTKEYNIMGYKIPPNILVAFAHQNMALMEEYYPRPHEYNPERWLVDKDNPLYYKNAHPFAYSPFGFGIRSCIGRRIAELEMQTLTARLVQNFHIEWFGLPPKVEQTSINYVKGPFNFIFKDAPQ